MNLENLVKWRKPDTKGHILYDCIYVKCSEETNSQKQEVDVWLLGAGEGKSWERLQKVQGCFVSRQKWN